MFELMALGELIVFQLKRNFPQWQVRLFWSGFLANIKASQPTSSLKPEGGQGVAS